MAEIPEEMKERLARAAEIIKQYSAEPPAKLLERAEDQRVEFMAELDALTEEQIQFSPGEGQWSIGEVCRHSASSLTGVAQLSLALATGTPPPIEGEIRAGVVGPDLADLEAIRKAVAQGYDAIAAATKNLEGDCNLEATFAHPWFGQRNCHEWVAFNILHMAVHVNQVKRIKAAAGYPG